MLLAEELGLDDFRQRVKIYATDVDEEALSQARAASYDAKAVETVPPEYLQKYFERVNGHYVVTRTFAAPSSSAATTWSRTRRSPASTCWHAATR